MITIHHVTEVPYTREALYALVNDVAAYPEFIPFCTVGSAASLSDNAVEGKLTFAWLGIVESFTTYNVLRPPEAVEITLVKGTFKSLKGEWQFTELPNQNTQVVFNLWFEFAFSNRWTDRLLQPIFNTLSYNAMRVFIQRAHDVHGAEVVESDLDSSD